MSIRSPLLPPLPPLPPLWPLFLYNIIIRTLFLFFFLSYPSISSFIKALCLIPFDFLDISHAIHFYWEYYQSSVYSFGKQNYLHMIMMDKIADGVMYLLFYFVVFLPLLRSKLSKYSKKCLAFFHPWILCFFVWRWIGILVVVSTRNRKYLLYFPDFLNSTFLVVTFFVFLDQQWDYRVTKLEWYECLAGSMLLKYMWVERGLYYQSRHRFPRYHSYFSSSSSS